MLRTHVPECLERSDGSNSRVIEGVLLRQLSPSDTKWDDRRAESDRVRDLYQGTIFEPYSTRISGCSGWLGFEYTVIENGHQKLKLKDARFCRVRHCPVCQWRRSLVWRAKAFKVFPKITEAYPKHRYILLTLTIKTCDVGALRKTIEQMNKAWIRLTKRKKFPAIGWIKSVEVTRSKDGKAHPHFHILQMVPSTYFKGTHYLSQKEWMKLWQDCLKIEYEPVVDVRAVKGKDGTNHPEPEALCEVLKYTVKPDDLIGKAKEEITDEDREWLVTLTAQLYKSRAVATGGVFKEYFASLEEEPEDLIHVNEDNEDEEGIGIANINFDWQQRSKHYVMRTDDD